jgi:hypothetical protein
MLLLNRNLVIFRVFLFRVILLEDSAQIPSQRNRIHCIRSDDMIFRPDAPLSKASSIRTMRIFRPDLPLCQEASNYSRLHPSGCLSNTDRRLSVFDKENDFVPNHRYGKKVATIRTMCVPVRTLSLIRQDVHTKFNCPDVILHCLDAQALIWK